MEKIYKVVVDYGLSLAEMIKACNCDWFNDDINSKHFPLQGAGQHEVELELVYLNRPATTKEVLEHLDKQGLESAKIEHLLAFGVAYPELQRQFPIVALGSSFVNVNGDRYSPFLDSDDDRRRLGLVWSDIFNHWYDICRFLAVGK